MKKITAHEAWEQRQRKALAGGGVTNVERQKSLNKLTSRERVELLVDYESFIETDQLVSSSFLDTPFYTDGVVTGFGKVNGRTVAVYSQDFTIKGGSLGKKHAEKICKIMDLAVKIGCPIVGIIDSGGARIDEGIHALAAYGAIFKRNVRYSGVVPQISIIVGPCAGGAVYSPALTDFIFMTENISQMFITGPHVIAEAVHQTISKDDLGGAMVHATLSGVAHHISSTEQECFKNVKALLEYLPSSYLDTPPHQVNSVDNTQAASILTSLVPHNPYQSYDIKTAIHAIVDKESFFEINELFAPNIVVGFARINGTVVGVVANQPLVKAGTIDIDASCKAARFIRLCNNFGIALVTLVDTPGYLPGIEQEHQGIIKHGAKLLYAYAEATVPQITIILRKAFGGAYIVMGSKSLGADMCAAWPAAQIAVLGPKAAVSILHAKNLSAIPQSERAELQKKLEGEYEEKFLNPFTAAENGYIDAIIDPANTRSYIISTLNLLKDKVETMPQRKSGNVPL